MADVAIAPSAPAASPAIKKTKAKGAKATKAAGAAKKPRSIATHPPTAEMVNKAIVELKERGGSSLQAIKKYLAANYKVDAEKLAPFIKKYLKGAVVNGKLVQTKGKGASGSFKLAAIPKAKKEIKKKPAPASGEAKKVKKPAVGKKPKVAVEKKKKPAIAKADKKPKAKSVASKQKSTKPKTEAKKQKTPKPKKAAPAITAAAKKPKAAAAPKSK